MVATDATHPLKTLSVPACADTALATLAEPLHSWFHRHFGSPTFCQRLSWPAIARGDNLLICSPTGSGKTLAAFAPIISTLLTEAGDGLRCLYVVPLKALGSDARKNLRRHLRTMMAHLPAEQRRLRVGLRTGDTATRVRRKLLGEPPDILITTPESLAVMLANPTAGTHFRDLRWVIVDEVHALAADKRGADLSLSLERLHALVEAGAGWQPALRGLQRIGLSATCAPVATAARFLVGGGRACAVAEVNELAPLHLRIEPLPETEERNGFMARLLDRLDAELVENRTTLVFTNTRSLAERMTWALRRRYPGWAEQIGVHHSALSAVRRRLVERGLKHGKLRVAVSSTSLELGVDIGSVDQVVLVHPPGGVVRLLQRVGRSGHQPRQPRHGLVLTETPAALLEAAVTAASGRLVQLEPLTIPQHPLDVLCQHLLGMAVQSCWSPEDAFTLVRQAYPYRDLTRSDFDACLDYLSGRHSDGRTWLPARLRWENGEFTVADQRTIRLLRRNSGTIVADENRSVRLQDEERDPFAPLAPRFSPLIGEVDELFADRLQPGDRFVLDGRCLEYQRKDGSALLVSEVAGRPQAPRWPGSGWPLSAELARRLYLFRVQAAEALRDGPECLANLLQAEYALNGHAVQVLVELFTLQDTISEIPDHDACLIECVRTEIGAEYYVHTPLNRAGNDALARVLCLRLTRDRGLKVTVLAADLGFLLSVHARRDIAAGQWYELLSATNFDADLDAALRESNLLRECFRRNALIGLMLLRNPLGRRRRVGGRDWAERCLFDQVAAADADFVLLRQARREVCESCAAEAARDFLAAMPKLSLRCRWLARPSPLVENWTHTGVTATDAPALPAEALQALREMLTTVPG